MGHFAGAFAYGPVWSAVVLGRPGPHEKTPGRRRRRRRRTAPQLPPLAPILRVGVSRPDPALPRPRWNKKTDRQLLRRSNRRAEQSSSSPKISISSTTSSESSTPTPSCMYASHPGRAALVPHLTPPPPSISPRWILDDISCPACARAMFAVMKWGSCIPRSSTH